MALLTLEDFSHLVILLGQCPIADQELGSVLILIREDHLNRHHADKVLKT
jgi:hypothetical protein